MLRSMNFIYRSTHMRWSRPQDPTERLRELCATLNDIPIQHTKTKKWQKPLDNKKNKKQKPKTKNQNQNQKYDSLEGLLNGRVECYSH